MFLNWGQTYAKRLEYLCYVQNKSLLCTNLERIMNQHKKHFSGSRVDALIQSSGITLFFCLSEWKLQLKITKEK